MNINIRPSTSADVADAVPLIYSSGPAAFEYVFAHPKKGDAQAFLRYAFVDGAGEFGYENHVSVLLDDELVGMGAAYSGDSVFTFTLAAARQILSHYGLFAGLGVIVRGLKVEGVVKPPSGKLHYIAHIGVSPAHRSKGIGTQLMQHLNELGREAGRSLSALDVSTENPRAEALYETLGFVVTAEVQSTLKNEYGTVPDHRRMAMEL